MVHDRDGTYMAGEFVWQGACLARGIHGRGCAWWGRVVVDGGAMHDMGVQAGVQKMRVIRQAVCILLECRSCY